MFKDFVPLRNTPLYL